MPKPATSWARASAALQGPLGGVVTAQVGEGDDAADRGDLHDVTAALGPQEGQPGDPQGAVEVGLHLTADLLLGQLLDRAEQAVSGVVDDHVQAAEVLVRPLDGLECGGLVGDVQLQRQHRLTVGGHQVRQIGVAGGGRDLVTTLQGRLDELTTEATRGTGDDQILLIRTLPFETNLQYETLTFLILSIKSFLCGFLSMVTPPRSQLPANRRACVALASDGSRQR